ncbi:fimbrillin family protein [Mucilaginibacter agri]|uniref:Endonuclease n=1 Tax=Mucilaginibacter agri TaxID=2695265 RepID=A0A965ZLY8_9SPHI|nr:fimbrillin family protein [Mucilaginibacter agri]NCD72492.1 endonuclease [Mucilaginibacter agri]
MRIRNLQFAFLVVMVVLASCRKDNTRDVLNPKGTEVRFSSSINGEIKTKAVGNTWEANDAIGVFEKRGTGLTNILATNKSYTTTGDGAFQASATDQTIYYPEDGSQVDFIAYYPYKQTLSGTTYPVDLTNQTSQPAIDLMYASAAGLSKTSSNAQLVFSHQLSKIEITVTKGQGVTDLSGLTTSISGQKTTASFDLATGTLSGQAQVANILAKTGVTGSTMLAEAIVLPTTDATGTKVVFTIGSRTFTWTMPDGTAFEAGKKYAYNVELKGSSTGTSDVAATLKATVTNWVDVPSGAYSLDQQDVVANPPTASAYMETPLITTDENKVYVFHTVPGQASVRNYAMLFDKKYKMAYWVAYPLVASYVGSSGRTDAWQFDPSIAQADQVDLSSSFGNGYDRGHQIPSADRTASADLNQTTFYYSNMTAQISSMNQGIWANLENQVRTWMAKGDTLYVVTGASIKSSTDATITYAKGAAIPKYYYKALALKKGDSYYTIGFKIDNAIIPSTVTYNNFRVSVSDLEKETGFNLFPKLSEDIKGNIDNTIWN